MTRKAVFTVRLSQASTQQVQIDYVTVDLTATAPDDYTAQRGTLTFLPGEVEKQITVDVRAYNTLRVGKGNSNLWGSATATSRIASYFVFDRILASDEKAQVRNYLQTCIHAKFPEEVL